MQILAELTTAMDNFFKDAVSTQVEGRPRATSEYSNTPYELFSFTSVLPDPAMRDPSNRTLLDDYALHRVAHLAAAAVWLGRMKRELPDGAVIVWRRRPDIQTNKDNASTSTLLKSYMRAHLITKEAYEKGPTEPSEPALDAPAEPVPEAVQN